MIEIYILLIIMIIGSVIALEIRDLLSSVIVIGAVGLCLSAAFLILKAPDLAMAQLIVEIVLIILLIRATGKKDAKVFNGKREYGYFVCVIAGIFMFLSQAAYVIEKLPIFGKPLMRISRTYLTEALIETKAANVVSAITLGYRSFDTFLAMVCLFSAVIAIMAISAKAKTDDS
jgi:multisubunit Na+/H+ antiporter MnhB subunit